MATYLRDALQSLLRVVRRALAAEDRVQRRLVDHDVEDALREVHGAAVLAYTFSSLFSPLSEFRECSMFSENGKQYGELQNLLPNFAKTP